MPIGIRCPNSASALLGYKCSARDLINGTIHARIEPNRTAIITRRCILFGARKRSSRNGYGYGILLVARVVHVNRITPAEQLSFTADMDRVFLRLNDDI